MLQKVFLKLARARRFRSGMIVLCAIGAIVLVAVGASPLLALGTVNMRVDPVTRAVPVNGTFTVDIVADVGTAMGEDGLGGYGFDLEYDPNYLEVISVSDAGDLGKYGRPVPPDSVSCCVDNQPTTCPLLELRDTSTAGRVMFGAYSGPEPTATMQGDKCVVEVDPKQGPTGEVKLAQITLKAKRAGVTTLNLGNARLTDTQANAWPDPSEERDLTVSDGKVWNIIDAFSYCVFESGPGTHFDCVDFDGDGKTDPARWYPAKKNIGWRKSGSNYEWEYVNLGPTDAIPVN